jgi:hypothetical protein
VSRVINNEPNVRAEMKKRVQDSIDKLGYVPSIAAQRMSGSRSYLILAINDRARTIADWQARLGTDWVDQMLLGGMLASGSAAIACWWNWSTRITTMSSGSCRRQLPPCSPTASS